MTFIEEKILEEYKRERPSFQEIGDIAHEIIYSALKTNSIRSLSLESRVKTHDSLEGKLKKHSGKYKELSDITDILGFRIITYFSDEVDKVGEIIEKNFIIDRENSVDKRQLMKVREFGYLSLHYIVSLPESNKYSKSLCGKKFEIQIRTGLQHIWAEIEHDIGYKGSRSTDRNLCRRFARIAGLLEIADKEFLEIRDSMKVYAENVRLKIMMGEFDGLELNSVTLDEFCSYNPLMKNLLEKILKIDGAEVQQISPDSFIQKLEFFGVEDIQTLYDFVSRNFDLAFKIAENSLKGLELDILASTVTLRNLCVAELVSGNYSEEKITDFLKLDNLSSEKIAYELDKILEIKKNTQK